MRKVAIFLLLTIAVAPLWSCQDTPLTGTGKGPLLSQYQGMLLPPGIVETPAGQEAYVTMAGDTTYMIAQRFYDKGWRLFLVEQANRDRIDDITLTDGTLEPGRVLFLPSDAGGTLLNKQSYPGQR